jgi:hypothetical protein
MLFILLTSRRIYRGVQKLKMVGRRSVCPPSRSIKYGGATSLGQHQRVKTLTSRTAGRMVLHLCPVYRATLAVYPRPENLHMSQHGRG